MKFYHSSKNGNIEKLEAISRCNEEDGKKCVYITDNYAYALLYIRDMDINIVTARVNDEGVVEYEEQFKNQLQVLYKHQSGYLYTCKDAGNCLKSDKAGVYYSKEDVEIGEKVFVKDVYKLIKNEIEKGRIVLKKFKDISIDWKKALYGHIAEKIKKKEFFKDNKKLARFYKKHYAEAWKLAKSLVKE